MPPKPKKNQAVDCPSRRRLPLLLRRAWYGLNQAFRRQLAHLEITPDQFTVMRTLLENEGITQRELTHLISSDPNTVAALVNRMEQAELLERETHEGDRRANRLRLNRRGKAKYEKARLVAVELQNEILSVLPESRREEFLEQLELIGEACRKAAIFSAGKQGMKRAPSLTPAEDWQSGSAVVSSNQAEQIEPPNSAP